MRQIRLTLKEMSSSRSFYANRVALDTFFYVFHKQDANRVTMNKETMVHEENFSERRKKNEADLGENTPFPRRGKGI